VYHAFRRISIVFNQQIHELFVNTYLFLITPKCFDTWLSSSGSCLYAKVTANWNQSIIRVPVTH